MPLFIVSPQVICSLLKSPSIITIPIAIIIIPPARRRYFCHFGCPKEILEVILLISPPRKRNGKEIPREYTNKSRPPYQTLDLAAARVRIAPRTGPEHGNQTKEMSMPIRKADKKELFLNLLKLMALPLKS